MTTQSTSRKSRSTVFYSLAILLLLALIFGYNMLFLEANATVVLANFNRHFQKLFIEALPFLLLGTLTAGLIEVFIRQKDIQRFIPKNPLLAVLTGLFLGILFPVAEVGVVPVLRRLFKKGLPLSTGIAFLLSAPFINPIILASSYIAFESGTIFLARVAITVIISGLIGLVFALNARSEDILLEELATENSNLELPGVKAGLSEALIIATNDFFEMGKLLVIGCLLAGAFLTLISPAELQSLNGETVSEVLQIEGYAYLLSLNSIVDSFAILPFLNRFSIGAIVAFLVSGSMLDLKSTILLFSVFKKRAIFYLIILVMLMNLLLAMLLNLQSGLF